MKENNLSPLGKTIVSNRDEIMQRWIVSMRDKMPQAKELETPILVNTLPAFIENIAQAVTSNQYRQSVSVYNSLADEHGGERARLTNYSHEQLIREYQILRWSFLETLKDVGSKISLDEMLIINASFDEAIQQSATAFTLVQKQLREHYIATLSHDMRNPLMAISMSADLLLRKFDDPQVLKQAAKIKQHTGRVNRMIEDLLDVTSINTTGRLELKLEPCFFKSLLEEAVDELEGPLQDRIKITGENVEGHWDKNYLKRAIENLLSNAAKYSFESSMISLKIESKYERLIFNIHNMGKTIPIEERESIFQIFRRANSALEGSKLGWGLGLPLVRAVAEAHGGSIVVESSEDVGTTFTFDIPVDARPFQSAPVTE